MNGMKMEVPTSTAIISLKFVLFEYKLIINVLDVWKVKVWLCD
jgi:hypothetical protein